MFDKYLLYSKTPYQLLVLSALFFMALLLGSFATGILNEQFIGLSSEQMDAMESIPEAYMAKVKWANALSLLLVLLLPAGLYAYLSHPRPLTYLKLNQGISGLYLLLGILAMVVTIPAVSFMEQWGEFIPMSKELKAMDDRYTLVARSILSTSDAFQFIVSVVTICILPAIIEELFFRGCLQTTLVRSLPKSPFTAILITAIIFSALHGQLSGFVPRIFLGMILGLAFHYSGNLWLSIGMHFLNNFLSVTLMFLYNRKLIPIDVSGPLKMHWSAGVMSLLGCIAIMYYFYQKRRPFLVEDWSDAHSTNENKS